MTTIDGTRAPGTLLLDGATLDYLDGESLRTGRSPAELVRLIVTADAIARADAEIATSVDGGVPSPGRPGVDAGQGTAARTPAPTIVRVLVRETDSSLGAYGCTEGEQDEDGRSTCRAEAWWKLCVPGETRWTSDPATCGRACCDHHIPDGWVRPDEVPTPAKPTARPVVSFPLPPACAECGERSEHEVCS